MTEENVCIFGDSITWGAWDREMGGWLNRLRIFIENDNYPFIIYNNGVSCDTTRDLLERFNVECEAREPRVIIFAIGINDAMLCYNNGELMVKEEEFKDNLEKLLKLAANQCGKIIFTGLTKINEEIYKQNDGIKEGDAFFGNGNIKKYNLIIKEFAKENNLLFIELFDLIKDSDLEDGLHPNAQGHEKIFQKVKECLIEEEII